MSELKLDNSHLTDVRRHLACLYLNEEDIKGYEPAECVRIMMDEISEGIVRSQKIRKSSLWEGAQQCAYDLICYEKRCGYKQRIIPEEIAAMIDTVLHFQRGSGQLLLEWSLLESLLSVPIYENIAFGHIPENHLPESLWIEISGEPSLQIPKWMNRTIGILLTRVPLDRSGKSGILRITRNLPYWQYVVDMLEVLCQHQGRCIAYTAIVAQQNPCSGYRFIPTFFGHEENGVLEDVLALHREITEKRRQKDIERLAAEICLRVLLDLTQKGEQYVKH